MYSIVFSFFLLLAAIILVFCFLDSLKKYKLVSRIHLLSLNQLQEGLQAIKGVISPTKDNILKAPLSGHECYWYQYEIEQHNLSSNTLNADNQQPTWTTVRTGRGDNFFIISDGSNQCLVSTHGADVSTQSQTWPSSTLPDIPFTPEEQKMMSALDPIKKPLFNVLKQGSDRVITIPLFQSTPQYQFSEHCLNGNDTVTVLGYYRSLSHEKIDTLLSQEKTKNKLIQTGARKEDILAALKDYLTRTNQSSVGIISLISPKKYPFIISSLSDQALKRYYIKSIIATVVGAIIVAGLTVFECHLFS